MSDDTDTALAPEATEASAVTEAPTDATATETPVTTTPEPEPAKPEGKRDWRETRIDQLTREKHEARREAERYKALAEAVKPAEGSTGLVPETEVEKRAAQIAEQREFASKLNAWSQKGAVEFKDFNERCATVAGLGLAPTERPEFMAIIADMDDGHKVVAHLADHPEAAMALSRQPTHRMAMELAKLSNTLNAPKPVSRAPAPVSAPAGAVNPEPNVYDPGISQEKFIELRKAARAAKKR